jgi:peroxiredoxin
MSIASPSGQSAPRSKWEAIRTVLWAGAAGTVIALLLSKAMAPPHHPGPLDIGDVAPAFALATADGGANLALEPLPNGVRALVFWATWCGPCRHEMPIWVKLHEELQRQGLHIWAISSEPEPAVRAWLKSDAVGRTVPFPVLTDPHGRISRKYGATALPHLVLLDAEGKVLRVVQGALSESELRSLVTAYLLCHASCIC